MTQNQLNVLTMYDAVLEYLDENNGIWTAIVPIQEKVTELSGTVETIHSKSQDQQAKSPTGFTAAKNAAMDTMVQQAYKMALKVKGYAKKAGDAVLLQSVDYNLHDLENGSEKEVINRCTIIVNAAQENLASLADYKVTTEAIAALATAINEAKPKTAQRDAVSGEKHSITLNIPSLFSQAREEVLDLDDLIKALIDDEQHDFINGYFGVRNINNRGERTKKDVPQPPVPNP